MASNTSERPALSRRRDLLLLFGLGLLVNGLVALLVSQPGYLDADYYFNTGLAVASGQAAWPRFEEPYFWNYAAAPGQLPAPGFAYWQPLPALLAALGIRLFGAQTAFGSAQALFVLLAAGLPPLTYLIAAGAGERRFAWLAGLLAAFSGIYVVYWSLPETFTPFALSGAGALALSGWGRRSGRWLPWLLAGACAGLAHLCRADGLLLAGIVVLVALLPGGAGKGRMGAALGGLLGYLLLMAPWLARNAAVFGSLLPPGGLNTLWLIEYNDLFNYPSDLSAARYFAAGAAVLLPVKVDAFFGNLATFVGVHNLVFLTPFTLTGIGRRWRADWLLPAVLYGLALFAAMTFAFSLPGVRGGWLHSGAALVPFVMVGAVLGLDDAIRWAAEKRGWDPPRAWRIFGTTAALLAAGITVLLVLIRVVGLPDWRTVGWNRPPLYAEIGAALDAQGAAPDAVVISNNPPGFHTHTGRGGIPLPNGGESTLLRAADDYGAGWLVIDHNVPEGLEDFYWRGPESERFVQVGMFGGTTVPVYLYRILPAGGAPLP